MPLSHSCRKKHNTEFYHFDKPFTFMVARYPYRYYHFHESRGFSNYLLTQFMDALDHYYHSPWEPLFKAVMAKNPICVGGENLSSYVKVLHNCNRCEEKMVCFPPKTRLPDYPRLNFRWSSRFITCKSRHGRLNRSGNKCWST